MTLCFCQLFIYLRLLLIAILDDYVDDDDDGGGWYCAVFNTVSIPLAFVFP